ncbi:membrane protein [Nocardia sputorum]|nr:membrane protein [Nocardia sputorum]
MMRSGAKVLDVVGSRRMAVATLATITGFYYLFVAFTNCVDTDTNRNGVAAVLSMKATIHNPGTDWRAITNGNVALVAYILVVIWEFLIAFVLLAAGAAWVRALSGRPRRIRAGLEVAAKLSSLGWTMAVMLFAGGFLTVGGEWFRMWANDDVNASSAALQNFLIAGVGLILVHLPDARPAPSVESASAAAESE